MTAGQERQAIDHGDRDDDRARRAHRSQERALEEQHRGKADGHSQSGEGDGAAGRGDSRRDRIFATCARGDLVSEPVDDEERVVDRHSESDERDDVQRVLRHVGEAVEEESAGQSTDDRQDADAERKARGHDGSEDDDEQDERHRQRHGLRALKVGLERGVEGLVDGHEAGAGHGQGR